MSLIYKIFGKIGIETNSVLRQKLVQEQSFREILEKKVKEADELAELYLEDQERTESKYKDLQSYLDTNYGKFVKKIATLPKPERELLCGLVPRDKSSKYIKDKICYHRIHNDPRGFKGFLDKLARCGYVDEIHTGEQIHRNIKKTYFNGITRDHGTFIIDGVYAVDNFGKKVFIHTTARNENEAFYVKFLLNSEYTK